jgi:hypothetical protein
MSRRRELAARRAVLVARCEQERREFGSASAGVVHSLRSVDSAVRIARRTAAHPLLLTGLAVAALVVIRPRRLWQFLTWGTSAAFAGRRLSRTLRAWA